MPLLPVALYGLEVPPGEMIVPAVPDFPATFRITMAAIDPTAEIDEEFAGSIPRATLKLIRIDNSEDDEESDEDEEDEEFMRKLLAESGSSDEDDDDEEEPNGGPSNPAKSEKAKKAAAVAQLISALENDEESDEDMADAPNGTNGKSSKKGKAKATDDEEDEEDEDSEDDEEDGLPEEFVICTLDPEKNYQQALDITIGEDELVYFKVVGTHSIHLTGNYVVPDDNGHNHHHEVYDSDEDEDYDLSPDEDELELELDEDESDDLDNLEDPRITEVDSEEETPKVPTKAEKKGKNKRAAEEDTETLDEMMEKTEEPKLSKKQLKKLKNNKGEAVASKSEEKEKPAAKADKKVQFAKNLEQGPTGSTQEAKTETKKKESNVRVVQGVKIDDRVVGKGRQAKKGNKVGMRYIGKLQDGKVFDANKSGQPFRFKLGSGEVIQGWDIGIAGIAVGGERRLVIPANLAYGSKSQPGIPANSTLTFDVKCLEIN